MAQREVQKQQQQLQQHQQQQRQQQLQTLAYDAALTYTTSPAGFIHYPPGYPLQTYVDPVNPNAGKVLLPTPPVEPLVPATLVLEQTPPQALITELGMTSPSSTSQPPPVSNLSSISQHIHQPTTPLELHHGTTQQYAQQPSVAGQDPGVGVLSVPAVSAPPQVLQFYIPHHFNGFLFYCKVTFDVLKSARNNIIIQGSRVLPFGLVLQPFDLAVQVNIFNWLHQCKLQIPSGPLTPNVLYLFVIVVGVGGPGELHHTVGPYHPAGCDSTDPGSTTVPGCPSTTSHPDSHLLPGSALSDHLQYPHCLSTG